MKMLSVPTFCTRMSMRWKITLGRLTRDLWAWGEGKNRPTLWDQLINLWPLMRKFLNTMQQFACASFDKANPAWNKNWKMPVPRKIKAFWWRVVLLGTRIGRWQSLQRSKPSSGEWFIILLVCSNLHKLHMEDHDACLYCANFHLLMLLMF